MWDGYLSFPRINVALLDLLKPDLLEAFKHVDSLEHHENLCALLASIGLESPQPLTVDETRDAIRLVGPKGRHEITHWIARSMRPPKPKAVTNEEEQKEDESEEQKHNQFFRERVVPWLTSVWPPETECLDSRTASNLALATVRAGRSFPGAVGALSRFWRRADDVDLLLNELSESKQAERFPEATLDLLSSLLNDRLPTYEASALRHLLDLMQGSEHVAQDARFLSLRETVLRSIG